MQIPSIIKFLLILDEIVRVYGTLRKWTKLSKSKRTINLLDLARFHNYFMRLLSLHQPGKINYIIKLRVAWKVYFDYLTHCQKMPGMNTRSFKKIVVRALSEYANFLNINLHTRNAKTVHETFELFRKRVAQWFTCPEIAYEVIVKSHFDNEAVMQ